MCKAHGIGGLLLLCAAVLAVGLFVPACSRNGEGDLRPESGNEVPLFVRLMREMPEARSFSYYDLDVMEKAFPEEARDKGKSELPYGEICRLLTLPLDWENELRAIFPPGSRGFCVKVWDFPHGDAHVDFYSVLQPKAWDRERFEGLLKKDGFTSQREGAATLWAGMGYSNYHKTPIELRITPQRICLGNFEAADAVSPDRNYGQLPRAKELAQLMYPDAYGINIDTPSRGSSIFGETHEGFASALRGNTKVDAVLSSHVDEGTAGRAQAWHVRDSASKKGPLQKGRTLIWETKEALSVKSGLR